MGGIYELTELTFYMSSNFKAVGSGKQQLLS